MTNNLFANNMEMKNTGGANQLSVTAQLNSIATALATEALNIILADESGFADQVLASQTDHDAMDRLLESVVNYDGIQIEFLEMANVNELDRVLKSQQSKRSRAKSQTMTMENYAKMMTAAIAEHLVREALGKPKGNGGGGVNGGDPTYSEEELMKLAEDPSALARAIRNVQSKKSIAKSKIDHDENGPRWQSLLAAEQQLKDLRASINGLQSSKAQEAIETLDELADTVGDVDVKSLKADEARDMLEKLQQALAGRQ